MREHTARIARNGVRSVAERSVDWALNRTAGSVRDSLIDEGAPKIVRYAVALVFEAVWPELALEIKANVMLSINESLEPYVLPWTEPRKVSGLRAVRAYFLYTFQPFDASAFRQLAWPSYWVVMSWSACPYYGTQGLFWLLVFLLMDRGDEYTLVNFILSFKALQFLTLGVASLVISGAQTQYCLTADLSRVTCDVDGPGLASDFFWETAAFVVQSSLVWMAFLLLPYSTRAAGTQVDVIDEAAAVGTLEEVTADPTAAELPGERALTAAEALAQAELRYRQHAGGVLRHFVMYDFLCFTSVAAYVIWYGHRSGALAFHAQGVQWQFRSTCVYGRSIYGLLSLPFLAFVIPPFNSVLTQARPTAYDQAGDAVPLLNPRQRQEKDRVARGEPARPPPKPGMYGRAKASSAAAAANARAQATAAGVAYGARVQGLNFRGGRSAAIERNESNVEQML